VEPPIASPTITPVPNAAPVSADKTRTMTTPQFRKATIRKFVCRASPDRHEMQIRCFKPVKSPIVHRVVPMPWTPASAHHRSNHAAAMTTTNRRRGSTDRRTATSRTPHPPPARAAQRIGTPPRSGRAPGAGRLGRKAARSYPIRQRTTPLPVEGGVAGGALPMSAGTSFHGRRKLKGSACQRRTMRGSRMRRSTR
jgi:hypothetical protein